MSLAPAPAPPGLTIREVCCLLTCSPALVASLRRSLVLVVIPGVSPMRITAQSAEAARQAIEARRAGLRKWSVKDLGGRPC